MSSSTTTTTTTTVTHPNDDILADYRLRHTNAALQRHENDSKSSRQQTTASVSSTPTPSQQQRQAPPAGRQWDTTHRRVPPYRPVDTERDITDIRTTRNRAESIFIPVLFTGVWINSAISHAWRASLGRIFPGAFQYPIGGEC